MLNKISEAITEHEYSKALLLIAASIVHAIKGLSPNNLIFLPGKRLLPPLAGIMAIFIGNNLLYLVALFDSRPFAQYLTNIHGLHKYRPSCFCPFSALVE